MSCLPRALTVRVVRLHPDARLPTYATDGSAGMDLYADHNITLSPGFVTLVRTGLLLEVPVGYVGDVRSRSGLAKRGIVVANSPGTIDSDFRGEVGVLLHWVYDGEHGLSQVINRGDRIAQLVIAPVPRVQLVECTAEELTQTARGAGGFGSTDAK